MVVMYGAVIRRARLERGLSQVDLASISGISQPNVSAIESGRRAPSAETLQRLLAACGYELLAAAGPRLITIPAPGDELVAAVAFGDDPAPPPDVDPEVQARKLVGALELAEAIVRGR